MGILVSMFFRYALSALAVIAGAFHIRAEYQGARQRVYLLKPLTTTLILIVAVLAPASQGPVYRGAIAAGLILSLSGDILLMLPSDHFMAGLISFLLAHLAYILALTSDGQFSPSWPLGVALIVYALAIYVFVSLNLGRRRFAVMVYMVVISFMVWAAWGRWSGLHSFRTLLAATGATFFLFSDSSLAINRFHSKRAWGDLVTLTTYYLAQLLIAWSI
ncbi:MAG: lysoplasmalogenase [Anaerolineales bacterium]